MVLVVFACQPYGAELRCVCLPVGTGTFSYTVMISKNSSPWEKLVQNGSRTQNFVEIKRCFLVHTMRMDVQRSNDGSGAPGAKLLTIFVLLGMNLPVANSCSLILHIPALMSGCLAATDARHNSQQNCIQRQCRPQQCSKQQAGRRSLHHFHQRNTHRDTQHRGCNVMEQCNNKAHVTRKPQCRPQQCSKEQL